MGADGLTVRLARVEDAAAMAAVHVQSWRETYRGLMPDSVLDAPDAIGRRTRMWTTVLSEPERGHESGVAVLGDEIVGIAMAGPPVDDDATWDRQLMVLYLLRRYQGSGVALPLVKSVLNSAIAAALWVADPNPRAQAFYAKIGFRCDGHEVTEGGIREVRMVRPPAH